MTGTDLIACGVQYAKIHQAIICLAVSIGLMVVLFLLLQDP